MTDRLGFTKKDIAKLNFKDEAQILQKMKKRHARMINADAARKIQKIARGFLVRLLVRPVIMRRRAACLQIQKFIRRYQIRSKLKGRLWNAKHYASVICQKYLRGYL